MPESATKRTSLLMRLRDPQDAPAWSDFVGLYAPMIYRLARRQGLQDADAAELTFDVLLAVPPVVDKLHTDPGPGHFRGWMFGLVDGRLNDMLHKRNITPSGGSKWWTDEEQVGPAEPSASDIWKEEHQRQQVVLAAEKAKAIFTGPAWQAFDQTAVHGRDQAEVAKELGISFGAVYAARCRVQAKIRQLVDQAKSQE
jgi:RNA polymerase sigma factor (sigma-70 family)